MHYTYLEAGSRHVVSHATTGQAVIPINGTDLEDINPNSIIIYEITNRGITQTDVQIGGVSCHVCFTNGFHIYCSSGEGRSLLLTTCSIHLKCINHLLYYRKILIVF